MLLTLIACTRPATVVYVDSGSTACSGPTWTDFGDGFFRTWCASCHSSTTPDRNGAPEGLDYETYEQVVAGAEAIRDAVLVRHSMPLGGGVYPDDLEELEAFLDCPSLGEGAAAEVPHDPPQATLDGDGVQAVVDAALPADDVPNPHDAKDRLASWLLHSTFSCPNVALLSFTAPWEGCTTDDGYTFSGLSVFSGEPAGKVPFQLVGDYRLQDPDGHIWDAGGTITVDRMGDVDTGSITGTWADASVDGWMQTFSGNLTITVDDDVLLDGSIGRDGHSLVLDDVSLVGDCTDGTVSVRDGGGWHRVELDCGCGPWSFEGQDLGELCIDLTDRAPAFSEALR